MLVCKCWMVHMYKCQRKPKGQSRMDNPKKLAALGTQDNLNRKHNTEN